MASYKSRINLRIPRVPEVEDESLYPIFQEIYNALHLINANLEPIFNEVTIPSEGTSPTDSATFKTFWAPAVSSVLEGRIVRPTSSGFTHGATGTSNVTRPFGLVLKERTSEGKALIGWPPGTLTIDNTNQGETIYANSSGQFTSNSSDWPVGICIEDGIVLLCPSMPK